ncbi:ricin-type beta-trefoil lectin domain protein [Endozoicomonas ascidiicola]|uniref:ricin-type beta-trefoil lectin domain protein n=1 Tax=Endozoicomonas ascidiicola TaxID=1698521 RepID=UPI00082B415A|nr:ricin-type beta-trefoil lectin domain protein [Endozoicomonas ascidiicola]
MRYLICLLSFLFLLTSSVSFSEESETFQLKYSDTGQCLTTMDSDCEESDAESCNQSIVLSPCDTDLPSQNWSFDFSGKTLRSMSFSENGCLSNEAGGMTLATCRQGGMKQAWYFNQRGELLSRISQRSYMNSLVHEEGKAGRLHYSMIDYDSDHCFISPFTGKYECIDFENKVEPADNPVINDPGFSKLWPWLGEKKKLTGMLKLKDIKKDSCLEVAPCNIDSVGQYDCFGGATIRASQCNQSAGQFWIHDIASKRLFNVLAGEHFCLSWLEGKFSLEHCVVRNSFSQKWYFIPGRGWWYAKNKGLLHWLHSVKDAYEYQKALPTGIDIRYFWKDESSACGFDPVDGHWISSCELDKGK